MEPVTRSKFVEHLSQLEEYDPEKYSRKAYFQRSKPFFNTVVYQASRPEVKNPSISEKKLEAVENRLKKAQESAVNKTIIEAFRQWHYSDSHSPEERRWAVWVSDTLAVDFNLRLKTRRPQALATQILFLAEQRPVILASVADPSKSTGNFTRKAAVESVEDYTITSAQQLKASLANFSSSDFAILRFTLDIKDATSGGICRAVQEELDFTRLFFKGRVELTPQSYADIEWAVQALVSCTHVPYFLRNRPEEKASLLLLDEAWSEGLSLVIQALHESGQVRCHRNDMFKVKVAVLEGAVRSSYNARVDVRSSELGIQQLVGDLKKQAERDLNPEPQISYSPAETSAEEWTTVTILPGETVNDQENVTGESLLPRQADDPVPSGSKSEEILRDNTESESSEVEGKQSRLQNLREPTEVTTGKSGEDEFVDAWFPNLETESYLIPRLHFDTVHASDVLIGEHKVKILKTEKDIIGKNTRESIESRKIQFIDNILKSVHFCMNDIKERAASKGRSYREVMLILTQVKCGLYKSLYAGAADMNNNQASSVAAQVVWDMKKDLADLLVIHRDRGILMGAVIGKTGTDPDALHAGIRNAVNYLNEAEHVVREFILPNIEGASGVAIHKTILFPNVIKARLEGHLEESVDLQSLKECLGVVENREVSHYCLNQDDMADEAKLERWWETCFRDKGGDSAIKMKNIYRQLVAKFSMPLTTVRMYLGEEPRIQVWTRGHVVREVGEEFGRDVTRLVLFPSQLAVLEERPDDEEDDDVIILHGPPGTGKTVLLVLRGAQWLNQDRAVVFVLRSSTIGIASAFQVAKGLRRTARRSCSDNVQLVELLDIWDSFRNQWKGGGEQKLRALVQTMRQHAATADSKAVHILADEADCMTVSLLYKALKDPQEPRLTVRLWAAGVNLEVPAGMQDRVRQLTEPLRCPPAVVQEIEKAWEMEEGSVPPYSRPSVQRASQGLRVKMVHHYHRRCKERHGHKTEGFDYPWRCEECGRQVARILLEELRVGCHDYAAESQQGSLTFNDVFVLGSTIDCKEATKDDDNNSPAPFIRGLQSLSPAIPVRKVGEGDTDTIREVAEMSTARMAAPSEVKHGGQLWSEEGITSSAAGECPALSVPDLDTPVIGSTTHTDSDTTAVQATPIPKRETATIHDAATVVREESIWGLERKVVVYLDQGGNFGADGSGRLRAFSRCVAQLIWVRPAKQG